MELNNVKKELYKQKPTARMLGLLRDHRLYICSLLLDGEEKAIYFTPSRDESIGFEEEAPAQLLIRWINLDYKL